MRPLFIVNLLGKAAALAVFAFSPAVAVACWLAPDVWLAYELVAPQSQRLVRTHRRFATARREVWLTIDDGPDPADTPRILQLLADHGARATFFVVGEKAARHPELIRAMASAGHEIGHHTHTHPLVTFWCASPSRLARELDAAFAALREAGEKPTRFRSPAGTKNLWLESALRARGLTCIGWSARGREAWRGDPATVLSRVTRGLAPGSILLLHEGPPVPAATRVVAIGRVLEFLTAEGYRCVVPAPGQLTG